MITYEYELIRRTSAASLFGETPGNLAYEVKQGAGPAPIKVGSVIFYLLSEFRALTSGNIPASMVERHDVDAALIETARADHAERRAAYLAMIPHAIPAAEHEADLLARKVSI